MIKGERYRHKARRGKEDVRTIVRVENLKKAQKAQRAHFDPPRGRDRREWASDEVLRTLYVLVKP